jgi:aerobic-type carbon monoxide dehydrogenase small subunit (CoxS/CutS family)
MILTINGKRREVDVSAGINLLSVLRNELELTGTKYGCGEGVCGACTVHIDGKAVHSCITSVGSAVGKGIVTIEGLEKNGVLHPVQEAFLQSDPLQCSYCASGMVMSAVSLLKQNSSPSDEEIITAMNGNICRCGTYPNIIKAIKLAANLLNKK